RPWKRTSSPDWASPILTPDVGMDSRRSGFSRDHQHESRLKPLLCRSYTLNCHGFSARLVLPPDIRAVATRVMNDDPGSTNGPAHRTWWDRLGHLFSGEPRNRAELIDELRAAQVNGLLGADTLPMLEGALKVTELFVDDVMVPRVQIVMIAADAPLSDILAAVVESGHSRFPVHGDDKDEILGILLAKDLLKYFGNGADFDIQAILRPAVLIPESMRLNVLLAEFRRSRNHMAL